MSVKKKYYPKKTKVQASNRVFVPQPTYIKVEQMLRYQETPVVKFYFKPHDIHTTKDPSKTIVLSDDFLHDYQGRRKSAKTLANDIEDMAHDYGADRFVI